MCAFCYLPFEFRIPDIERLLVTVHTLLCLAGELLKPVRGAEHVAYGCRGDGVCLDEPIECLGTLQEVVLLLRKVHDHELITADTEALAVSEGGTQLIGKGADIDVAGIMALGVIDVLQAVQVGKDHSYGTGLMTVIERAAQHLE